MGNRRIDIPIGSGLKLTVVPSEDPSYPTEMYVGITDRNNAWVQDLAVIMKQYRYKQDGQIDYSGDSFKVLVYGDENSDDYTQEHIIRLRGDL